MRPMALPEHRSWPLALVAVWALAAAAATLLSAPAPVALPVAGTFLTLGPGMAVTLLLGLRGTAVVLTIGVGFSLAALVLIGQILLVFGAFQPKLVVSCVTALTLLCCLGASLAARRTAAVDVTEAGR